jgi:hypothetical protein
MAMKGASKSYLGQSTTTQNPTIRGSVCFLAGRDVIKDVFG